MGLAPDYHMHTRFCGHASGEPREYIERALAAGMKEMGFSDHFPLTRYEQPGYAMRLDQVESYVATIVTLAREYDGDITILLGVEVDFFSGDEAHEAELLSQYPFDYKIGSVHFIGDGFAYDHPDFAARYDAFGVDAVYVASYALVAEAAATGLFDIIGHLDLAKKHGHRPHDQARVVAAAEDALVAIAHSGAAIEINTAGWRKPVGEAYPAPALLQRAAELGIPLTFGSDAHRPTDVGADFERARQLALESGYRRRWQLSSRSSEPLE